MRYNRMLLPAFVLALGSMAVACNRGTTGDVRSTSGAIKEETPGLAADAKVDPAKARQAALAKVPGGKIVKEELERENGKLVYSFDIKNGSHSGIEEVLVDAVGGSVVSVAHEDAAKEAAEAKQEGAQSPEP
jgi:uncharacterized membrane protein YkoI